MDEIFFIFIQSEAGHVLNLFLFSQMCEPQRSYKHGSYSTNSMYTSFHFSETLVALKRVRLENEKEGFPITAVRQM